MKAYLYIKGVIVLLLLTVASCSEIEYNYPEEAKSNGKEINDFALPDLGLKGTKINDSTIAIVTQRTYDVSTLKSIAPSFKISAASSVEPSASQAQNFVDTVYYYVTSERGVTKKWTVFHKYRDFTKSGIGEVDSLWFRSHKELGNTPLTSSETSIGTIGDKVVLARTGYIFNQKDGSPAHDINGGKLNFNGIDAGKGNEAQNIPFILANDDSGNLVGCTLGAWSNPYFRVYKWKDPVNSAQLVLDYKAEVEQVGGKEQMSHYGRRLHVRGDVDKDALISSLNVPSGPVEAYHDFWFIRGGQYKDEMVRATSNHPHKSLLASAIPLTATSVYPFFVSSGGLMSGTSYDTSLKYVWMNGADRDEELIKGPEKEAIEGGNSQLWGKYITEIKMFKFYNKEYLAVLYRGLNEFYLAIVDFGNNPQDVANYKIVAKMKQDVKMLNYNNGNPNGTTSIAVGTEEVGTDGVSRMKIFFYMTGNPEYDNGGMVCYEFNNLDPEFNE